MQSTRQSVPPIARPPDELTYTATTSEPPVAPRRPSKRTLHGVALVDDYAWLKDANWQEVLRKPELLDPDIRTYLEAENRYTEAFLGPLEGLKKTLVGEMRGRIKEDDSSVPQPDGPFAYLWKFNPGGQHETIGRTPRATMPAIATTAGRGTA